MIDLCFVFYFILHNNIKIKPHYWSWVVFFLHHFLQKLYLKNVMSFVSRLSFQNNSCNNFMYTEWYNLEKRKVSGLKHITVCNILGLRSGKHTHTDGIRVGFIYWGKTQYSPPPLYPSVWSTLDAVISPIWSQAAQGHCWVPHPPPPPTPVHFDCSTVKEAATI